MKENYYEILEINKNASPEIIEKVYKILVKKYHPDLQENNLKIEYEEKIKKINEAYDILSNPEERKKYDLILKNNEISQEDYNKLYNENINLKNEINYLKNNIINNCNNSEYSKYNDKINKKYNNTCTFNLKNTKLKINYKKFSKDFLALIITIFIIIIISLILWHIPFTKNYLINLYNENSALRFIFNLFFKNK